MCETLRTVPGILNTQNLLLVFVVNAIVMQGREPTVSTFSSTFGQAGKLNFYVKSDFKCWLKNGHFLT